MTATDRLRELLDERGVEWSATSGSMGTIWTHWDTFNGCRVHAMDNGDGTVEIFGGWDLTPEQAIAATLGSRNCTNDCTNGERTETLTAERVMAIAGKHQPDYCSDTHVCFDWQAIADELNATLGEPPRLPYFWTHDGALHVELPKLPESISVRLPDQRDREVGSARTWQYTRDSGTCKLINAGDDLGKGTSSCMCFECGYTALDDWWDEFNYCPNCGRRCVG